jgi:hypothetical protein
LASCIGELGLGLTGAGWAEPDLAALRPDGLELGGRSTASAAPHGRQGHRIFRLNVRGIRFRRGWRLFGLRTCAIWASLCPTLDQFKAGATLLAVSLGQPGDEDPGGAEQAAEDCAVITEALSSADHLAALTKNEDASEPGDEAEEEGEKLPAGWFGRGEHWSDPVSRMIPPRLDRRNCVCSGPEDRTQAQHYQRARFRNCRNPQYVTVLLSHGTIA